MIYDKLIWLPIFTYLSEVTQHNTFIISRFLNEA